MIRGSHSMGGGGGLARLVYLIGAGFSGSTLLAFLANAHSRIASVGEVTGPVRREDRGGYLCSCGATLASCPFWRRVGELLGRRGVAFGPDRWDLAFEVGHGRAVRQLTVQSLRHPGLDRVRDALLLRVPRWGPRMRELARRNVAFVDAVLEITGKSVLVDATKDAARARLLVRLSGLDVRIVHLVRDAPGQVGSVVKNRRDSLERGIRHWNRAALHARRIEALVSEERFLRMRYEDLCTRPAEEMARLARFAGVEPEPLPADFRATDHHIIGNRMRTRTTGEIVLDESWRERLTPTQIETILRRTADNRRRLGFA
jgi:hypothetical protein